MDTSREPQSLHAKGETFREVPRASDRDFFSARELRRDNEHEIGAAERDALVASGV